MATKPLWESTRDLHHACEAHAVGGAMATGKPPRIWYKAWLMALYQIHSAVDANSPKCIGRTMRIFKDLQGMDNEPEVKLFKSAADYVASLDNEKSIERNKNKYGYQYNGKILMYVPDFIVDNEIVEIKGLIKSEIGVLQAKKQQEIAASKIKSANNGSKTTMWQKIKAFFGKK
jgi:hypothetical protein